MRLWFVFVLLLTCAACDIPGRDAYNRGVSAWDSGDFPRAQAHFEEATQQNPDLAEAYLGLAECYVRAQQLKDARAAYQKAQALFAQGKFHDTPIEDNKKTSRVKEQLEWLDKAIALDEEAKSQPSSGPAPADAPSPPK
jgi:tetratricopeptide (TPR) repeat protein